MHVLFVCTGNICRSPTAERLAVAQANKLQFRKFKASSAGTRAVIGSPIHHESALIIEQLGADPSDFAARQLTPRIASSADLVITMTKAHRDTVLEMAPTQLRRTFTLGEAACLVTEGNAQSLEHLAELRPRWASKRATDLTDPIGRSSEVYAQVGAQIALLLPPIIELCRQS